MTLIDVNLLLYAYDADSPRHAAARRWLAAELSSGRPIRLALISVLAFVRIASDRRVFTQPLAPSEAGLSHAPAYPRPCRWSRRQ